MAKITTTLKELLREPSRTDLIYGLAHAIQLRWPNSSDRYFRQLEKVARKWGSSLEEVLNLNQTPVTLSELETCAPETLGGQLLEFYKKTGLTPDLYQLPLEGASAPMARVVTASRNIHDVLHIVTGLDTSVEDEMCLQAFLAGNTSSAFSALLVFLGHIHLVLYNRRSLFKTAKRSFAWWKKGRNSKLVLACDLHELVKAPETTNPVISKMVITGSVEVLTRTLKLKLLF